MKDMKHVLQGILALIFIVEVTTVISSTSTIYFSNTSLASSVLTISNRTALLVAGLCLTLFFVVTKFVGDKTDASNRLVLGQVKALFKASVVFGLIISVLLVVVVTALFLFAFR